MIDLDLGLQVLRRVLVDALDAVTDAGVQVIFEDAGAPRPRRPHVTLGVSGIATSGFDEPRPMDRLAITAVNQAARQLTVAGVHLRRLPAGRQVQVADSTGNDGTYTITAVALVGANTRITVAEALASAAVNGVLTGMRDRTGTRVVTFPVNTYGAGALDRAERLRTALESDAAIGNLRAAGWALYVPGDVTDLTGLIDTGPEERATFDARLAAGSAVSEYTGIIEQTEITATAQAPDGAVVETVTRTFGAT